MLVGLSRLIFGDLVNNLRSAIDGAYWHAVSPFVSDKRELELVQFPFTKKLEHLESALLKTRAARASEALCAVIRDYKPYCEPDGNVILWLINHLSNTDKHRFPVPVADYKRVTSALLSKQVLDFPRGIVDCSFQGCGADVSWRMRSAFFEFSDLGRLVVPTTCVYEKKVDVPVDVVLNVPDFEFQGGMVSVASEMVGVATSLVNDIRNY